MRIAEPSHPALASTTHTAALHPPAIAIDEIGRQRRPPWQAVQRGDPNKAYQSTAVQCGMTDMDRRSRSNDATWAPTVSKRHWQSPVSYHLHQPVGHLIRNDTMLDCKACGLNL